MIRLALTMISILILSGCVAGVGDGQISDSEQAIIDEVIEVVGDRLNVEDDNSVDENTNSPEITPTPTPEPVIEPEQPALTKEVLKIHGRYNGDRPTFYGSKNLNQYPDSFYFTAPGCLARTLLTTNGQRLEYGGYGGWIFKQSDVGRPMGIIGPAACQGEKVILEY